MNAERHDDQSGDPDIAAEPIVSGDLYCVGCSYNLRTLAMSGRCPECGLHVRDALVLFPSARKLANWLLFVAWSVGLGLVFALLDTIVLFLLCQLIALVGVWKLRYRDGVRHVPPLRKKVHRVWAAVLCCVVASAVTLCNNFPPSFRACRLGVRRRSGSARPTLAPTLPWARRAGHWSHVTTSLGASRCSRIAVGRLWDGCWTMVWPFCAAMSCGMVRRSCRGTPTGGGCVSRWTIGEPC